MTLRESFHDRIVRSVIFGSEPQYADARLRPHLQVHLQRHTVPQTILSADLIHLNFSHGTRAARRVREARPHEHVEQKKANTDQCVRCSAVILGSGHKSSEFYVLITHRDRMNLDSRLESEHMDLPHNPPFRDDTAFAFDPKTDDQAWKGGSGSTFSIFEDISEGEDAQSQDEIIHESNIHDRSLPLSHLSMFQWEDEMDEGISDEEQENHPPVSRSLRENFERVDQEESAGSVVEQKREPLAESPYAYECNKVGDKCVCNVCPPNPCGDCGKVGIECPDWREAVEVHEGKGGEITRMPRFPFGRRAVNE